MVRNVPFFSIIDIPKSVTYLFLKCYRELSLVYLDYRDPNYYTHDGVSGYIGLSLSVVCLLLFVGYLHTFSNSSFSYTWIVLKSLMIVQNGNTQKLKELEFWFFTPGAFGHE